MSLLWGVQIFYCFFFFFYLQIKLKITSVTRFFIKKGIAVKSGAEKGYLLEGVFKTFFKRASPLFDRKPDTWFWHLFIVDYRILVALTFNNVINIIGYFCFFSPSNLVREFRTIFEGLNFRTVTKWLQSSSKNVLSNLKVIIKIVKFIVSAFLFLSGLFFFLNPCLLFGDSVKNFENSFQYFGLTFFFIFKLFRFRLWSWNFCYNFGR